MSDLVVIDSIHDAVQMYTGNTPDHPLIHVLDLSATQIDPTFLNTRICSNLYSLALKQHASAQVRYGRNHYDFSSGVITAYAPGQIIQIDEAYNRGDLQGWSLMFHPDLLLQHPLQQRIHQYGYFSYDIYEALHASEQEQHTLNQVAADIRKETRQNQDEFSLDILLTSVELLLTYTDRYFNRQFLTRKPFYHDSVERFRQLVNQHLEQAEHTQAGLPSVSQLASDMHMSANYMSDLLRKQTGYSAQELIHQYLIEKAKYRLLNSDDSIATIAYQLGFENPQYFSRIFKQKTSLSPQQFRQLH